MNTTTTSRPVGFWITAADRLLTAESARAYADAGLTRRDGRVLSRIAAGRTEHLHPHKLHRLAHRGWIDADTRTLTDAGRDALDRANAVRDGIRATLTDAVSPDDLATTIATLEQITRALGWEQGTPLPRRRHHGHRHGGHRHPHACREQRAERGCSRGERAGEHGHRSHDKRRRGAHLMRFAQGAYERGFAAGFDRGRDAL